MINLENEKDVKNNAIKNIEKLTTGSVKVDNGFNFSAKDNIKFSKSWNSITLRDKNKTRTNNNLKAFTKEDVIDYLSDPISNENNLINASNYIYIVNSHYRRMIQYFCGLTNFSYVVVPHKIDVTNYEIKDKSKIEKIQKNFRKTLDFVSNLDIVNQFSPVLTTCFREDTFFGTFWVSNDNVTLQQLPSKYCNISTIQGNVFNVNFDFSYFDSEGKNYLEYYPDEFKKKYQEYKEDRKKYRDLDSPNSFAVKVNKDIPLYSIPPFCGIFPYLYDINDYRNLKLSKTELENYMLLVMTLGLDKDGNYNLDYKKAKIFYDNLNAVLPDEVGSVLSPLPINKIDFEKSASAENNDNVYNSEKNAWSSAGINANLFMDSTSSSAIKLSTVSDQEITYSVVKSIENVINRYIQSNTWGKNFKLEFLNISEYNRQDMAKLYKESATLGLPTVNYYASTLGISQDNLQGLFLIDNDIYNLVDRMKPLKSSYTQSSTDNESGRPKSDVLTDSGEATERNDSNKNNI